MTIPFSVFEKRYMDYAGTFRLPDGTLSEPMRRKLDHTLEVVEISRRIAKAEHFSEEESRLADLAALFHDVARYRQVQLYHSFNDVVSKFDHGHEGVRILYEKELLAGLEADSLCAVAAAVEMHNKPGVDFSRLGGIFRTPAMSVRDADKLAILRLLTDYISGRMKVEDTSVFLLDRMDSPEISPAIVEAILAGRPALHRDMHTVNDFKLTLFAWSADLNYPESARFLEEKKFYGEIRSSLPDLPVVDEIYRKTLERLKCLSSKSAI